MNQFANIGSMFPGAQNKAIRDKLKQLLTMPGNRQVTGLVLTDEKKDTMIVNGESASVTFFRLDPHGPKTLEAKWLDPKCWDGCQSLVFKHEAERVLGIAQAEFAYWKKVCDEDPGGYGIEGMAAAANIVAAITMGTSVEDFKAGKADYDRATEPEQMGAWAIRKGYPDALKDLREKFDNLLAAEVKRHGGIPHLSEEEVAFREAMAAFLEGGAK
jgi:hypothetical protein